VPSVGAITNVVCRQSIPASNKASSDDGSADEGVTVVDSPTAKNGSTQSSPTFKKEKA